MIMYKLNETWESICQIQKPERAANLQQVASWKASLR